jgi:hypothetical protein
MELPTSGRKKVDAFIREIAISNPDILNHYDGCPQTTVNALSKAYNKMQKKKKSRRCK